MLARWKWLCAASTLVAVAGCGVSVIDAISSDSGEIGEGEGGGGSGATSTSDPIGGGGCVPFPNEGGGRTGIDRQVRDMTEEEATAWCQTFVDERWLDYDGNPGATPSPHTWEIVPGYIGNFDARICDYAPGGVCIAQPTVELCVENLRHAPCEGRIVDLDQCVDSFFTGGGLEPCAPADTACGVFHAAPHCDETVAVYREERNMEFGDSGLGGGAGCYLRVGIECQ